MDLASKPSALFVYFTCTNQKRKVIDARAEVLRGRVCDAALGGHSLIEESRRSL